MTNETNAGSSNSTSRMTLSGSRARWSASLLLLLVYVATAGAGSGFSNASLAGLMDTSGRELPADPYPEKYRMVLFGFTSCADVCPLTLLALREAMQLLGARSDRVVPIFISVDPARDDGPRLLRYVRAFEDRRQLLSSVSTVSTHDEVAQRIAAALDKPLR